MIKFRHLDNVTSAYRSLRGILQSVLTLFAVTACVSIPDGMEPVSGLEVDRYLGTWYEIARLDHSFERGLSNVTATYSKREDGGLNVINRGYKEEDQVWKEAEGKAYFVAEPDVGRLKVSFFGPFYGGYNIVELDKENYQYAIVAGPTLSYLWILARQPNLDATTLKRLEARAKALGFDTSQLIYVSHYIRH